MALTCPQCGVLNRCDCMSCNPDKMCLDWRVREDN